MSRTVILSLSIAVAVFALAGVAYFILREQGDEFALARLDRIVEMHDGSYENATFDLTEGRLVVTDLILHDYAIDQTAEPLDLVEVEHLDVSGLVRFDFLDALGGTRDQHVLDVLNARGIQLTEDGQTIELAALTMSDVSFARLQDGWVPTGQGELTRTQLVAQAGLFLNASEIHLVGFRSPPEGPTGMQVNELRFTNVRGGAIERIEAADLSMWDQGQVGTIGDTVGLQAQQVTVEEFDAGVPLRRAASGEEISYDQQSNIPIYERFTASNITITEEDDAPLGIDAVSLVNRAYEGVLPTESALSFDRLRLPLEGPFVDEASTQALRDLGYEELVFSIIYEYDFALNTGEFNLSQASVDIEELGALEMNLLIGGIPFTEDMIDQTASALMEDEFVLAVLEGATLDEGSFSFTDQGVFARIVEGNSARAGQSAEEYLADAITQLEASRQELASSDLAVQTIDALIVFFEEPGTLRISAAPDEPVPFQQLLLVSQINPILLVEIMNLHVNAESLPE